MARYAGSTVEIVSFATKPNGSALLDTDVDTATATVFDINGVQKATGSMSWDAVRKVWFYDWVTPTSVDAGNDFFAKCTLVSTSLNFTNHEWRSFSVRPSPV